MHRHRLATLLLLIAASPGCQSGETTGTAVSGRVRYQGKPIEDGMIFFQPEFNVPSRGASASIRDGRYSILAREGPQKGKHRVAIYSGDPSGWVEAKAPGSIPAKYNAVSELQVTIPERKAFEFDFDLE